MKYMTLWCNNKHSEQFYKSDIIIIIIIKSDEITTQAPVSTEDQFNTDSTHEVLNNTNLGTCHG